MKKYIHITKADRAFLMRAFDCSERMVYKAIRFEDGGSTALANRIRKVALDRGGIVMVVSPIVETLFDHDDYIRQYFPNGVLLELNKTDSSAVVLKDGEEVKRFEGVTLNTIGQAQAFAAAL